MSISRSIPNKYQTGSALVIGLIILLLMFILGTAGMRTTILEEKMAGNSRDLNNAFQAAELGLQDGEQDLSNKDPITYRKVRPNDYKKIHFSTNCINTSVPSLNGLCLPADTNPPKWIATNPSDSSSSPWDVTSSPLPYREYGQYTSLNTAIGASSITPPPDLASVSRQPRYILEYLYEIGSLVVGRAPAPVTIYYRVTTQGYGIAVADTTNQPLARVMLQSVYGR